MHDDSLMLLDMDTTYVKSTSCMLCGVLLTWNTICACLYNFLLFVSCRLMMSIKLVPKVLESHLASLLTDLSTRMRDVSAQ